MDVRPCRNCKKLFNYLTGQPICPACKDALEEKFIEVKEYVREHPNEGVNEVAKANEVTSNQIKRWIREERLAFSEDSGIGIDCESCGKVIRTGRLCQKCKDKLLGKVEDMYHVEDSVVAKKHREAARMRFLEK